MFDNGKLQIKSLYFAHNQRKHHTKLECDPKSGIVTVHDIYYTIMKYVYVYLCCTVYHKHFRFDNRKRRLVDCALYRLSGIRRECDFANFAAKQTRLRAFYDTALGLSSVCNSICPRAITAVEIHTG